MITTITRPDTGRILLRGEPLNDSHPALIGYMPEERGLYKKMKVGDQLLYLGQLKGLSKAEAQKAVRSWFEKFGIMSWWDKKVEELSKGMQQKAQFIATVLHNPPLLILDEPFSGLDPLNANLIKDEIDALHRNGTTIIFSTHRMEQVEEICDHIILIHQGKNILDGAVQDVRNRFKENLFHIGFAGSTAPQLGNLATVVTEKNQELVVHLSPDTPANAVLSCLIDQKIAIRSFHEILPTLNEIFIKQVGTV